MNAAIIAQQDSITPTVMPISWTYGERVWQVWVIYKEHPMGKSSTRSSMLNTEILQPQLPVLAKEQIFIF